MGSSHLLISVSMTGKQGGMLGGNRDVRGLPETEAVGTEMRAHAEEPFLRQNLWNSEPERGAGRTSVVRIMLRSLGAEHGDIEGRRLEREGKSLRMGTWMLRLR